MSRPRTPGLSGVWYLQPPHYSIPLPAIGWHCGGEKLEGERPGTIQSFQVTFSKRVIDLDMLASGKARGLWISQMHVGYLLIGASFGITKSCRHSPRNSAGCNIPRKPIHWNTNRKMPAPSLGPEMTGLHSPGSASCHFLSICHAGDMKPLKWGRWSCTAVIAHTPKNTEDSHAHRETGHSLEDPKP